LVSSCPRPKNRRSYRDGGATVHDTSRPQAGCTPVTSAATVDKALAMTDAQVFDAAILDINLNGYDSHPVAEALSARGLPFVYSTGNTDHGSTNSYSGRPVLRKPFKFEELVAILTRLELASVER
jgi:DNA-binding response OmpR family regulator